VQAVDVALLASLVQGRERLSWLCSRDTHALTEEQVRETAVESLAENLNDSVVAPLFWFACFGLPGAVLYRFANTADAMWGYRGVREGRVWEWAGKWAARCDDALSWVPARITALALMVGASCKEGRALWTQAQQTPSPNSGWPMAAMALALHVRLGKPGVYALNPQGQAVTSAHVAQACRFAHQAVRWVMGTWAVAVLLGAAHV
jgi:adenosylcobinamide-phosphate synthase